MTPPRLAPLKLQKKFRQSMKGRRITVGMGGKTGLTFYYVIHNRIKQNLNYIINCSIMAGCLNITTENARERASGVCNSGQHPSVSRLRPLGGEGLCKCGFRGDATKPGISFTTQCYMTTSEITCIHHHTQVW